MLLGARFDYVLALALLLPACANETLTESGTDAEAPDKAGNTHDAGAFADGQVGGPKTLLDASLSKPDRMPLVVPAEEADGGNCDTALEITIRDFTEKHPDFEHYSAQVMGIVQADLGPDKKPVYAGMGGTAATTGPAEYKQWYNDVDGVNKRLSYKLQFTEQSDGVYVYDSSAFFPIDEMGFGNGPKGGVTVPLLGTIGGSTPNHNFLFTTEAHTVFLYRGGETFKFTGDDDMWVFLNNKLAIDLGGTHSALSASVDLDADAARLGLEKGKSYPMDIFHAERHTDQSNYHIETTIDLSCIENVPIPYI